MHHPTDRIAHTTAFVTPVVEHWLEREIAQLVYPMKDRSDDPSHHERTVLPQSYVSLPHQNGKPLLYVVSGHGKDVEADVVGFPAIPGAMLLTFLINFGMEDVYDVLVDPECGKEAVPRCEPSTYQPICR